MVIYLGHWMGAAPTQNDVINMYPKHLTYKCKNRIIAKEYLEDLMHGKVYGKIEVI